MTKDLLEHGTWDTLLPLVRAISRSTCDLPYARLLPGERQILGGSLFPDAGALVERVSAALLQDGAPFPDLAVSGTELLRTQGAAYLWASLRNHFQLLAERAADTYVKVQSLAVQRALSVVHHVRTVAELPASREADPGWHEERLDALMPALLVLAAYRGSLVNAKKRRKEARMRSAVSSPSPSPSTPTSTSTPSPTSTSTPMPTPIPQGKGKPALSPQRRRALAERKARTRAQLSKSFRELARSGGQGRGPGPPTPGSEEHRDGPEPIPPFPD